MSDRRSRPDGPRPDGNVPGRRNEAGQKAWSANSSREGRVARKFSGKWRRRIVHRADVVQTSEYVGISADAARTSARATSARRRFGPKRLVCKYLPRGPRNSRGFLASGDAAGTSVPRYDIPSPEALPTLLLQDSCA